MDLVPSPSKSINPFTPSGTKLAWPVSLIYLGGLRHYTNAAVALCAGAKGDVSAVLHSSSAELGCEHFSHVYVSCSSEMFPYLVRGIFCGWTQRLSCSDGRLTRFRGEKEGADTKVQEKGQSRFLPAQPGAHTPGAGKSRVASVGMTGVAISGPR